MHGHPIDIWTGVIVVATLLFAFWSIKYLPGMAGK